MNQYPMSKLALSNLGEQGMWVLFGSFSTFSNFYRFDLYKNSCVVLANIR